MSASVLITGSVLLCLATSGCQISNYGLITDNNQTRAGGGPGEIRDTRGKAKLVHGSQWALWVAGETIEQLNYVRQNTDGAQTLYTHSNISVEGEATFSDDLYCSPERQGCAGRVSFDKNAADPEDDPFNFRRFEDCPGAIWFSATLSTDRYYGECGRTRRLSLQDRLSLWNSGELVQLAGREALHYRANRSGLSIHLSNEQGLRSQLPLAGDVEVWLSPGPGRAGMLDARNPLIGQVARSYAGWVDAHATDTTTITGCLNGICRDWTVAGRNPEGMPSLATDILSLAHRAY
ncbi:hypothetical protein ABI59_23400 [Acidobacteria bacterium Mor1]|nr:hypothetical protein ABI59_23400 [Acidobacteria bacterium Mor1]